MSKQHLISLCASKRDIQVGALPIGREGSPPHDLSIVCMPPEAVAFILPARQVAVH